jgi:TusA-related sulfurtransferase
VTYTIEKGIPIGPRSRASATKYPFEKMEVGDSFEVETNSPTGVATGARQWAERHGMVFTTRRTKKGIRIWRRV